MEEENKQEVNNTKKEIEQVVKAVNKAKSGNVLGALKEALKSKQFKKKLKKKIIMTLIQASIPIIIAVCLLGVLNKMKDTMIDLLANTGTAITGFLSEAWQWMTNDYWIKLDEKVEYIVDVETGEILGSKNTIKDEDLLNEDGTQKQTTTESTTIVDQYIKELGKQGVSLEALRLLGDADYSDTDKLLENEENKELVEKYIAEFIRADIITQQPHKNRTAELVNPNNQNWIDGGIYIYRTKKEPELKEDDFTNGSYTLENEPVTDKSYELMEFMNYDEFMEKLAKNDKKLRYRFTIDKETGELIVVEIKETQTASSTIPMDMGWFNEIAGWFNLQFKTTTEYELKEVRIDYKQYISKYTMPYEFLINLCEITQNPEFVYHVALLARDTKIVLAIQDNITMERETLEVLAEETSYKNDSSSSVEEASVAGTKETKTRTVKSTKVQTPVLRVEYADTWSFYEEFDFTKNVEGTLTESGPNVNEYHPSGNILNYVPAHTEISYDAADGAYEGVGIEKEIPEHWEGTFTTKTETSTQVITMTTTYNEAILKETVEKSKQFLGLLRNSTGKCSKDCFEESTWKRQNPIALECAQEAVFDRTGINVQYRIPNIERTESPLNKLTSGIEMLYAVLQSNGSGYKEENKLNGDTQQSDKKQQEYIASKDYESAYVVKMQGLVEHLRYLMTFPENESYTIKDLLLDIFPWIPGLDDNQDIIVDEGTIASAREIYEFLIGKGMSPESACAILGNIHQESSFRTGASNGTHYGLCQWGGSRWDGLKQFAEQRGTSWTDLDTQLEYLWTELCGTKIDVKNAIMNSTDMEYATDIFCRNFEICGNYGIEVPRRYNYAKYWYNIFVLGNDANTGGTKPATGKLKDLFPNGLPQTQAEMQKYLVTIEVPITTKSGNKSITRVTVHKAIAADVKNALQQAQNAGFKVYQVQGYNWRYISGTNTLSQHAYGVAVDINITENCQIKNGKVTAGSFWKPGENEYSIPPNGALVNAFKSKGWGWGGNFTSSKDYMHFSYTGK